MESIFEILGDSIRKALEDIGLKNIQFTVEYAKDENHGDFATNVAILSAKDLNKDPKIVAESIYKNINKQNNPYIEKMEIAGPGFINFFISDKFFLNFLNEAFLKDKDYGKNNILSDKKVIIEYTDPNPFKELHIGHLMSNAIGESLSRILEACSANVKRANYQGDVGLHVAKAIWGLLNGETDLGRAYALGAEKYEEDEHIREEIILINSKIYDESDDTINSLYKNGKEESLERFESIYTRLGTKFDFYFFESETGKIGKKIVEENTPGVFEESDGAIIYRGEKKGLHTRVFITNKGLPTYEAKELGLAFLKEKTYPHDISFVVTGNEVSEYFKVAQAALSEINEELAKKTKHITHGMMRLSSGKMSSRTGDVITAEDLIDKVKDEILKKIEEDYLKNNDLLLDSIAIAAIKYGILKQDSKKDIIFDFKRSTSFLGDSGPYLQYTHARTKSLLNKSKEEGISVEVGDKIEEKEKKLVKELNKFPYIIERSLNKLSPHYVATYLNELAHTFNAYYANQKIIDKKDPKTPHRLAIVKITSNVLSFGIHLLGMRAPDKM